jgi:hypothetical protein
MTDFDRVLSTGPSEEKIPEKIGMIAGNGTFPLLFLEEARNRNIPVVVLAHKGETDPEIESFGYPVVWVRVGQVSPIFDLFHKESVVHAAFVGGIKKPSLFEFRPDLKGLSILAKVAIHHDDQVLRALADAFLKEGITIVPSTILLPEIAAGEGVLGTCQPTAEDMVDIKLAFTVGKALGEHDIGQCVVVREKVVLAVEAIEGTDETIRRGARYGPKGVVVAKMVKPGQDLRFDLPAVGIGTLAVMEEVGASTLAIEAGETIILDGPLFIMRANKAGISVVGVKWD